MSFSLTSPTQFNFNFFRVIPIDSHSCIKRIAILISTFSLNFNSFLESIHTGRKSVELKNCFSSSPSFLMIILETHLLHQNLLSLTRPLQSFSQRLSPFLSLMNLDLLQKYSDWRLFLATYEFLQRSFSHPTRPSSAPYHRLSLPPQSQTSPPTSPNSNEKFCDEIIWERKME